MGNNTEFERAVYWLSENLTFDVDARINLFEVYLSIDSYAIEYMIGFFDRELS